MTLEAIDGVLRDRLRDADRFRGGFARWVRSLGTFVKPSLYCALALMNGDAMAAWSRSLDEAIASLADDVDVDPARRFYKRARRWLEIRDDEAELETMARDGVTMLRTISGWYSARGATGAVQR
jgi:hypothetical protein